MKSTQKLCRELKILVEIIEDNSEKIELFSTAQESFDRALILQTSKSLQLPSRFKQGLKLTMHNLTG